MKMYLCKIVCCVGYVSLMYVDVCFEVFYVVVVVVNGILLKCGVIVFDLIEGVN